MYVVFKIIDFLVVFRIKNIWIVFLNVWYEILIFSYLIQCYKVILDNVFFCFFEVVYQLCRICRNGWFVQVLSL